jgi:hypothetical protein
MNKYWLIERDTNGNAVRLREADHLNEIKQLDGTKAYLQTAGAIPWVVVDPTRIAVQLDGTRTITIPPAVAITTPEPDEYADLWPCTRHGVRGCAPCFEVWRRKHPPLYGWFSLGCPYCGVKPGEECQQLSPEGAVVPFLQGHHSRRYAARTQK